MNVSPYSTVFNLIKYYLRDNKDADDELFNKILISDIYDSSIDFITSEEEESDTVSTIIEIYKDLLEYLLDIDDIEKQHVNYDSIYDEMMKLLTTYYNKLAKAAKKVFNPIKNKLYVIQRKQYDEYKNLKIEVENLLMPVKIYELVNSTNYCYYTKVIELC